MFSIRTYDHRKTNVFFAIKSVSEASVGIGMFLESSLFVLGGRVCKGDMSSVVLMLTARWI